MQCAFHSQAGRGGDLTDDETTIITGALNMTEKRAKEAMTPISKTFSLDLNSKLDMYCHGIFKLASFYFIAINIHVQIVLFSGIQWVQ